jgi:hypothetical protein
MPFSKLSAARTALVRERGLKSFIGLSSEALITRPQPLEHTLRVVLTPRTSLLIAITDFY